MGASRLVAAVIEQHHDEKGCIWTQSTAPYMVNVMVSNIKEEAHMAYGEELYAALQSRGIEAMLDDRKERFGFKMSDAELIGFPFTVIVGKELENGLVQIMVRSSREMISVNAADVLTTIEGLIK